MPESDNSQPTSGNWKTQALVVGAVIGALVGAGAAYLLTQRAESNQERLRITAGDGVKLGVLIFGLLRQVAQLGEGR